MRIILASASPRRKELLEQAGIAFEIQIGNAKECITKEEPGEIVEELSLAKAQKVAEEVTGDAVIIGADTIVAKDREILGKPGDAADAHRMLALLQGTKHQVYTGVTLIQKKGERQIVRTFHERMFLCHRCAMMKSKRILPQGNRLTRQAVTAYRDGQGFS